MFPTCYRVKGSEIRSGNYFEIFYTVYQTFFINGRYFSNFKN
jgi:hypothetical protein